jgi:hypothetical protein
MTSIPIFSTTKPSISTRKSISWAQSPPTEDSSVLVLTSRLYKDTNDTESHECAVYLDLGLSLPLDTSSKLNWGLAGVRRTLETKADGGRVRWEHIIDSRAGKEGSDVADEGEVKILMDKTSGERVEVETGVGWNEKTKQREGYEEVWTYNISISSSSSTDRMTSDEPVSPNSPYLFLTLNQSISTSTAFIAILGQHALLLSLPPSSSPSKPKFEAARMHCPAAQSQWKVVFSTSPNAMGELSHVVCLLVDRDTWNQGSMVELFYGDGSRTWTVTSPLCFT